ncbi:MAG: hypothetical protein WD851_13850 [Pirellulales bacterium]
MLADFVRDDIERLLAEGRLSRREVARRLGVSRTVVRAIAAEKLGRQAPELTHAAFDDRPRQRCVSCGYAVPLPCVYCRAKAYRRRSGCA